MKQLCTAPHEKTLDITSSLAISHSFPEEQARSLASQVHFLAKSCVQMTHCEFLMFDMKVLNDHQNDQRRLLTAYSAIEY